MEGHYDTMGERLVPGLPTPPVTHGSRSSRGMTGRCYTNNPAGSCFVVQGHHPKAASMGMNFTWPRCDCVTVTRRCYVGPL